MSRALVLAALLSGVALDAAAQTCDAGLFLPSLAAPGGVSIRMTRSAAVLSPTTGWSLEACFLLAHRGTSPQPASALVDFRAADAPGSPAWMLFDPAMAQVGGVPTTCQVVGGGFTLQIASTNALPPFSISQECCVSIRSGSPSVCEQLPHEPDIAHVELTTGSPPIIADVAVLDRSRGRVASGKIAFCGLTGLEILLVPLAQLAMRRGVGRRARKAA